MSPSPGWKPPSGLMEEARRIDLEKAWQHRELEASALRSAGFRSMAINIRFYGFESRIKAYICEHLGLDLLPRVCKIHDLGELLIFTGRHGELHDPSQSHIKKSWDILADFSKKRLNDIRYLPDEISAVEAEQIHSAFDDPIHGVIAWLSGRP